MLESPDSEQDYLSKTAIVIYKIGHDKTRLMKWIAYYDQFYHENINYYDLMGSVLTELCKYTYICKYISSINTSIIV